VRNDERGAPEKKAILSELKVLLRKNWYNGAIKLLKTLPLQKRPIGTSEVHASSSFKEIAGLLLKNPSGAKEGGRASLSDGRNYI